MPAFIAATEPLSAAQTVKPEACSSFDAFLSVKKSMRSLLCQRRKKCAFLTEEKSTKRLIEATASNSHASAGKAYTHGSQQTEPRTYVRSPSFAVRKLCATGKPAPAGAKLSECALGSHKRLNGTFAVSFRSFLVRRGKEHFFIFSESAFLSRPYTDGARRARSPSRRHSNCFQGKR